MTTYQCKCTACENHMTSDEFEVHECPAIAGVNVKEFGSDFAAYDKACKVAAEQWRKEQEMDEYTQHEVISEMSEEEKVENDIKPGGIIIPFLKKSNIIIDDNRFRFIEVDGGVYPGGKTTKEGVWLKVAA